MLLRSISFLSHFEFIGIELRLSVGAIDDEFWANKFDVFRLLARQVKVPIPLFPGDDVIRPIGA